MGVSKNNGTPKSSILIGFSIINHPFWDTPIFGNTNISTPPTQPVTDFFVEFPGSKGSKLSKRVRTACCRVAVRWQLGPSIPVPGARHLFFVFFWVDVNIENTEKEKKNVRSFFLQIFDSLHKTSSREFFRVHRGCLWDSC